MAEPADARMSAPFCESKLLDIVEQRVSIVVTPRCSAAVFCILKIGDSMRANFVTRISWILVMVTQLRKHRKTASMSDNMNRYCNPVTSMMRGFVDL